MIVRRPTGVYNAGSCASVSIGELVEIVNESAPVRKALISADRVRESEVMETVADCSRAFREFGRAPEVTLAVGIRELVREALSTVPPLD